MQFRFLETIWPLQTTGSAFHAPIFVENPAMRLQNLVTDVLQVLCGRTRGREGRELHARGSGGCAQDQERP